MAKVFWAVLMERTVSATAFNAFLNISEFCARQTAIECIRIGVPYARTDMTRNMLARLFMEISEPDDTLVMLDNDHNHPNNIVTQLTVGHPHTSLVIGAMAHRRSEPYNPLFFIQDNRGAIISPSDYQETVYEGVRIIPHGAIAIRRPAFEMLSRAGFYEPWWRLTYNYPPGEASVIPGEDNYFSDICWAAGIKMWLDCRVVIPHIGELQVGKKQWDDYYDAHPDMFKQAPPIEFQRREEPMSEPDYQEWTPDMLKGAKAAA